MKLLPSTATSLPLVHPSLAGLWDRENPIGGRVSIGARLRRYLLEFMRLSPFPFLVPRLVQGRGDTVRNRQWTERRREPLQRPPPRTSRITCTPSAHCCSGQQSA